MSLWSVNRPSSWTGRVVLGMFWFQRLAAGPKDKPASASHYHSIPHQEGRTPSRPWLLSCSLPEAACDRRGVCTRCLRPPPVACFAWLAVASARRPAPFALGRARMAGWPTAPCEASCFSASLAGLLAVAYALVMA
jgi:hypothetical protein